VAVVATDTGQVAAYLRGLVTTRATGVPVAIVVLSLVACSTGGTTGDDAALPPTAAASSAPARAGEEAKIAALARSLALATEVGKLCRTDMTTAFVRDTFGSVAACEDDWVEDDPADRTVDADVADVHVNELAATAVLTLRDAHGASVRGTWAFARVGEDWRLAVWGVDFLRSLMSTAFGPAYRSDGPQDPLDDPVVRGCVGDRVQRLSDAALTTFVHRLLRESARAKKTFGRFWDACALVPGADGLSPARRAFETGLRQGLERQALEGIADCVNTALRSEFTDTEILRAAKRNVRPPAMQGRIDAAGIECAREGAGTRA
jgi:hypothetical protein